MWVDSGRACGVGKGTVTRISWRGYGRLMTQPHVIILNGASSVGKSATARAIQEIAADPFLHIAMDDFLGMLPPRVLGAADGIVFEPADEEGIPCTRVKVGSVVERALTGMRSAVAAMAAAGNNLVVDDVMWGEEATDYRRLLGDYDLRFVGLAASLEVLEERERLRGDRAIGLARWQHRRVHRNMSYDLELDANVLSAIERAQVICTTFRLGRV